MGAAKTDDLFPEVRNPEGTQIINERCMITTQDGHRVVLVSGIVLASYAVTDRMAQGRYRRQVLNDEAMAQELGLSGVPASLVRAAGDPLQRAVLVEGAQRFEVFQEAVTRVLHAESRT